MQDLIIEPRAAGRLYERGEDASETPWGDVILWKPPHRVVLAWRINEVFAYDPELLTEVDVRFVPRRGDLCSVEFEHRGLERMGAGAEMARGQLDGGWAGLLDLFKGAAEMTA
jgi:uncharacterized protein YndB with AHSA1/START domain